MRLATSTLSGKTCWNCGTLLASNTIRYIDGRRHYCAVRPKENKVNIEKNVLQLISGQSGFDMGKLKGDDNRHDLGFDSLDDVELIMALEEQFDIEIPDAHAEELKTVRDIIDYITTSI